MAKQCYFPSAKVAGSEKWRLISREGAELQGRGVGFNVLSSPSLPPSQRLPPVGACPADTLEDSSPGLAVFLCHTECTVLWSSQSSDVANARRAGQSQSCCQGLCISAVLLSPAALGKGRGVIFRDGQDGAPVTPSCSRRVVCLDVFVSQGSLCGSVFMRWGEMTFSLSALTDDCSSL